jgi:outer membrane biosynthesis protein TonB
VKARDASAGKRVKCPQCGAPFRIPDPTANAPAGTDDDAPAESGRSITVPLPLLVGGGIAVLCVFAAILLLVVSNSRSAAEADALAKQKAVTAAEQQKAKAAAEKAMQEKVVAEAKFKKIQQEAAAQAQKLKQAQEQEASRAAEELAARKKRAEEKAERDAEARAEALEKRLKERQEASDRAERVAKEKAAAQAEAAARRKRKDEAKRQFDSLCSMYSENVKIMQVIDDNTCLLLLAERQSSRNKVVAWKGPTRGLVDDLITDWDALTGAMGGWVIISGTYRYQSTTGQRTVPLLQKFEYGCVATALGAAPGEGETKPPRSQ